MDLKKDLKKAFRLGLKATRITGNAITKEVKSFASKNVLTKKEAKELLKDILNEVNTESKRILSFAMKEAKQELGKSKKLAKRLKPKKKTAKKKLKKTAGKKKKKR